MPPCDPASPSPGISGSETGAHLHRAAAAVEADTPAPCAIITVSDTRTPDTDRSGSLVEELLNGSGHRVVSRRLVPDEPQEIRSVLDQAIDAGAAVVLFNGGTGISTRDTTYDALAACLEKSLPGFGELFRMLSWEEIGPAAMMSRAMAGVYRGAVVFSMPGSTNAVRLAMERLILPELGHMVWELRRQSK